MDNDKKKITKWICIGLLIIAGIGVLALLVQVIRAFIVPVIGIIIVIWLIFGDALAENWRINKQRQALDEQRLAVENEQRYYKILREIVWQVLREMLGIDVYEDLLRYDGPYIYGPGAYGPVYYYEIPGDIVSRMTRLQKEEFRRRLQRKIAKKYHMSLGIVRDCIAYATGPGGMYLVLISLDASVLPALKSKRNNG